MYSATAASGMWNSDCGLRSEFSRSKFHTPHSAFYIPHSEKWSERQDFHLRPRGPKPRALKTELRSENNGGPEGTRTLSLPADNGLLWLVELRIQKMVGGAGNAPVVTSDVIFFDTGFTDRQPGRLPNW
jgi:hypothetical protein